MKNSSQVNPDFARFLKECGFLRYWSPYRNMYLWKNKDKIIRTQDEEKLFGVPIGYKT